MCNFISIQKLYQCIHICQIFWYGIVYFVKSDWMIYSIFSFFLSQTHFHLSSFCRNLCSFMFYILIMTNALRYIFHILFFIKLMVKEKYLTLDKLRTTSTFEMEGVYRRQIELYFWRPVSCGSSNIISKPEKQLALKYKFDHPSAWFSRWNMRLREPTFLWATLIHHYHYI